MRYLNIFYFFRKKQKLKDAQNSEINNTDLCSMKEKNNFLNDSFSCNNNNEHVSVTTNNAQQKKKENDEVVKLSELVKDKMVISFSSGSNHLKEDF